MGIFAQRRFGKWPDCIATAMNHFATASGLATGYSHRQLHYNCQDAYALHKEDGFIVGVVADGCGSGSNSEVGAQLGAAFAMNFLVRHCRRQEFDATFLLQHLVEYLHQLRDLHQPANPANFVENYLLFTLLGFVVTPKRTHIFHSGDGYLGVNGVIRSIDHGNRPRYIGLHLIGERGAMLTESLNTADLQSLLIGTDGLRDWPDDLQQICGEDEFFENEIALSKRLTGLAVEGTLKDDAAVVLLRR